MSEKEEEADRWVTMMYRAIIVGTAIAAASCLSSIAEKLSRIAELLEVIAK